MYRLRFRSRSPISNPGDRGAQNSSLSVRLGGSVSLTDHVFGENRRVSINDPSQVNRRSVLPSVLGEQVVPSAEAC